MPTYHITVTVTWVQSVDAANEENAKQIMRDTFKDQYNFVPQDVEIIEVEEQ